MIFPEDLDFIDFFNALPIEVKDEPWVKKFQISDPKGVSLLFIVSLVEEVLHCVLSVKSVEIAVLSSESLEKIEIIKTKTGKLLKAAFRIEGQLAETEIRIHPDIHLRWHVLRC